MSDMNPWGTYMMTEHIMDGMNTSKLMFTSALKIEEAAIDLGSICKFVCGFYIGRMSRPTDGTFKNTVSR